MSEREAHRAAADGREQWFESPNMWWLAVPAIGIPVLWWSLGVSYVLGTWAAGRSMGWPGAMEVLRAAWGLARGRRLDEAWLLAGDDITAIATAWWLAVFAALAVAVPVSWAAAAAQWRAAGWQRPEMAAVLVGGRKNPDRPRRDFIRRKWPVPGPFDHRCPGPGVLLGRHGRRHLVSTDGLPVLVVGSTGSGKTRRFLGPNTAHYPGPVVATSVKQDLAELTLAHRKTKGRVYGFEPTGRLHGWMVQNGITPVAWDPVRFMATDPTRENADMLAQFLAGQSSAAGQGSQSVWPNLVQAALSDMLLIATEIGASLSDVLKWMTKLAAFADKAKDQSLRRRLSPEAREALDQLASDAEKDPRITGSIEATAHELTRSLKWTAKTGARVESVPVDVTVNGGSDTLFLIADHSSQSTHEALFGAVLRHLFHIAETGVLDPDVPHRRPLFALDEFANLARLADMPKLISTIRSRAQVIIGIQTPAQLAASWGKDHATTIMDNCAVKIVLPGSSDSAALQTFVTLTDDDEDDSAVATAASWRMIEDGYAMAVAGNRKPFCFKLADAARWLDAPEDWAGERDGDHGPDEGASPDPAEGASPDDGIDELEPVETIDTGPDADGAAERLFDPPPEVPPYELLYESPDMAGLGGRAWPPDMDEELADARERIKARLARTVPLPAEDDGGGAGGGGGERGSGSLAAVDGPGGAGWAPPPVLQAGNALGISTDGVEARDAEPAYEMLTFADADGEFGLHPSGCVVDLGESQTETQKEALHEHELIGV
ncbi:MAG: type IV secretion system DNA-binding domain-containing protein [Acidimicrobiia bacterium]|nr:type IV secretion system DNA-binding domain-containing protein [Acidimicrobiia bacterium]MYJ31726.1 type IV secretion system DNA-binding domain-containing protein [Acidimicrobiia bacterium]